MSRRRARRLDPGVRPGDVALAVRVDPEQSDRFSGEVRHELTLDRARRVIELHCAELSVSRARVTADGTTAKGRIERCPERETVRVHLTRPVGPGPVTLALGFRGGLRSDLRGFYLAHSGEHRYALTQLAATHARRMFPCFDEPAMKARFSVRVTTRPELQVIANQPVREVSAPDADGFVTWDFTPTPPLASYLVALAIGRFVPSRRVRVGRTPIRVWHVPGKEALTGFALRAARESLARLETWFALPHPYEKVDLVAVPDFEFGAMENAGAVFFRESALLLDPATASAAERHRVAEIVAHELSHMWFGNLVTMAWWDDLWLNESFATWMAFHVVDDWKPEWELWRGFQQGTAIALATDALADTHPVYTVVHDVDEATENFDEITYEKGAAIVRMIARSLGPAFRRGVRAHVRAHREGNATAADLWRALEEASGRDVRALAEAWITQPGYPLVTLRRTRHGRSLALEQRPFRMSRRRGVVPEDARWPVVFRGAALAGRTRLPLEARFGGARTRLPLAEKQRGRPVLGNAEREGFFRVAYAPDEMAGLAAAAPALRPIERMGLVDDAWALTRAGAGPLESFLMLADALAEDEDPMVLGTLAGPLRTLGDEVAPCAGDAAVAGLRRWLAGRYGPPLRGAPFARRAGDEEARAARAHRLAILGLVAEDARVRAAAHEACLAYLDDATALAPEYADVAVSLAARAGDAALFERLERSWQEATTPQGARRALLALPAFRAPELVDRALAHTLGTRVAGGDVALVLVRAFANPEAAPRTWRFLTRHWGRLSRRVGGMLVTRVVEATAALGTSEARREVAAFFRAHPIPTGERTLRQTLERFDLERRFRRRAAPELCGWLEDPARPQP